MLIGLGALLLAYALGLGAGVLLVLGALLLGPTLWWRWKTREFRRGMRALRRGQRREAESWFDLFLQRTERDGGFLRYQPVFNLGRPYDYRAAAHNNLGVLHLRAGKRDAARREFDRALASSPRFAPACYGRGALHLLEGDLAAAEASAREGLRAEPGHRPCSVLAALCRAELGDREGAEALLASLRKPIDWESARHLWAQMYSFWGAEDRSGRWG